MYDKQEKSIYRCKFEDIYFTHSLSLNDLQTSNIKDAIRLDLPVWFSTATGQITIESPEGDPEKFKKLFKGMSGNQKIQYCSVTGNCELFFPDLKVSFQ